MKTIINDNEKINKYLESKSYYVVDNKKINNCCGCFGCWLKTPLTCIHEDFIKSISTRILNSEELILISKCVNGCLSSLVKKTLERSIGTVKPLITVRNKEIHHKVRRKEKIKFTVIIYGDISIKEKEIITKLIKANSINLNTKEPNIIFAKNIEEVIKYV